MSGKFARLLQETFGQLKLGDPFAGLMGGIKTCKKIMNNEFEYVPPQKNRWPTSEKEIIRNQNTKVELTRYKRVKKYDDFVFKTSGYEVDHVCAGKC